MSATDMQVALLAIGNEILRGDTLDTNSNFLARELAARGAVLRRILTIPDELELIAAEVRAHAESFDRVITTGGIGPTPDDLTRDAVGLAFGRGMVLYEDAAASWRARKGTELNAGQLAMCTLPREVRLITVQGTAAPGFVLDNVYVLAGVPSVMKEMWASVASEFSGRPRFLHSFMVRLPESRFALLLAQFQARHPELEFGSYPKMEGDWYTEIKVIGLDAELVGRVGGELEAAVSALRD